MTNPVEVLPPQISQEVADLIDDLKSAITEGIHNSRWELIKAHHYIGAALIENEAKLPKGYAEIVAAELKMKPRTIYQCLQFARNYPDINTLPLGKNISWHKIANDLLPEHKEKKETPEEKLAAKITAFFKAKSVERKDQAKLRQYILEWELFKGEK